MKTETKYILFLVTLSLVLFFTWLGKTPLWILDEVRNAECAREMYERGDWIVPTFNAELRTQKPPLHYFFMFGGFKLFGFTEWGARFFSAVTGLATVLITFLFVKRSSGARHAFFSSLVLLCSVHFLFEFRMSVPDPYLIFFNTVSIFTALEYFKEKKLYWLLICGLALGLGALAKGPVAIALPCAAVLVWLIWEKKWKEIFTWHILAGGILMLAVTIPWYLLVDKETNGEWTRGFFFEHNFSRFSKAMEGHKGPFILVLLFALAGLLPAAVFIGESLKNFKNKIQSPLWKLSFSVVAVFIVFYSISSTKLPNYAMPCYPFFAILLGKFIDDIWDQPETVKRYPFFILLLINLSLLFVGYWVLDNEPNTTGIKNISFFLVILSMGAIISLWFAYNKKIKKAFIAIFTFYTLFHLVFFSYIYPTIYRQTPLTKTIDLVKSYDEVVGYDYFHPSFTYYLPERIPEFKNADSLKAYLKNEKAVIISNKGKSADLERIGFKQKASVHDIFELNTTVIYTNGD